MSDEDRAILDEAKALRQSGEYEQARTLIETSGIDFPGKKMKHGYGQRELQLQS